MTALGFSLFAGGAAQRATVQINGRVETLAGPQFTIAGSGTTQAEFREIEFPSGVVTERADLPLADGSVAGLTLTDRPADGATLFDTDGDGRIETARFAFDPTAAGPIPQLTLTQADADIVTVTDWATANVDLAASAAGRAFDVQGVRDGLMALSAGNDELLIDTGAGSGLLQIASGAGNDAIDLEAPSFYTGSAQADLGDGNDTLRVVGDEDNFHILAASSGAEGGAATGAAAGSPAAADMPVPDGAGTAGSDVATGSTFPAGPTIFPPVGTAPPFRLEAEGGAGDDRFLLENVQGRVAGGEGDDLFELDRTEALSVTPGAGVDTVVLRNGASATIAIDRADTGTSTDTADTLRFSGTSVSSSTVELSGFAAGATARIVPDTPASVTSYQPVQNAQLQISEPGDPSEHIVELIGVNTDQLEGLTVLFA
jgi:hypothetical protein